MHGTSPYSSYWCIRWKRGLVSINNVGRSALTIPYTPITAHILQKTAQPPIQQPPKKHKHELPSKPTSVYNKNESCRNRIKNHKQLTVAGWGIDCRQCNSSEGHMHKHWHWQLWTCGGMINTSYYLLSADLKQ